ncbi:FlgO family outer membrane protein [Spirosoma foliorum]|uniref:FlgO domain-containing protein n=1 Tax=Spirosoma foliorum TaxID=2710596 RepID=A0A7G5GS73_9BACT|nr:FlgO family outer membrane protein [Spirosoma foliorum]QMW01715.1 hypothetical protein H3H32_27760 [Spirosoma foliorum]
MRKIHIILFLVFNFLIIYDLHAQYDLQIKSIAQELGKKIAETNKKRIAVADFTDTNGSVTQFGQFLSEEFNTYLPEAGHGFLVIDRSRINILMQENQLQSKALTDPSTAIQLGRLAGIEALIYGTYTSFSESVRVNVKIIDIQRGIIIRSVAGDITRTPDIDRLINGIVVVKDPYQSRHTTPSPKPICSGRNSEGILITLKGCSQSGDFLTCQFTIYNDRADKSDISFSYKSRAVNIITDAGEQYGPDRTFIGSTENNGYADVITNYYSKYGITVSGSALFAVGDRKVKNLQLFEMQDQELSCKNIPVK